MGEWLVNGPEMQMIWLIMLLPSFGFAYEFGYKGGVSFACLVLLGEIALKWRELAEGELRFAYWIRFLEFTFVLLVFSVSTSVLSHRLHVKRKKLEELAYHDPLTGLYNRTYIQQELERLSKENGFRNSVFTVLFIDVDNFKFINDTYGHDTGDMVLKEIADRLNTSKLKKLHHSARLGGDEFILVLIDIDKEGSEQLAQDLQSRLSAPFLVHNLEMFLTFSMGIACFPEDSENIEEIFQNSDIAMYQAKQNGKNQIRSYSQSSRQSLLSSLKMEQDLRKALIHEEFELVYQPQVDVTSKKIVGLEALLRWNHPESGMVPPDVFIPIAERIGLIVPLGEWVLQESCRICKKWQKSCFPGLRIAVNVSPVQFQDFHFVRTVLNALHAAELPSSSLELEITERIALVHSETITQKLRELKDMGIRLALDDFGSGYSSLNYLVRYPIDVLKIDKAFVHSLSDDSNHTVLMETLIELAHRLQLEVVAEGVEDIEQYFFCQSHACDMVQGYFMGRPMPQEAVETFLHGFEINKKISEV